MTHRTARDVLALLALCALLFVPAAAFRGLTGMEFRTALFVREILARGPSLIPRFDGVPYFDYPPLYFLAAALSSRLLGAITPLTLALPSILAAAGTALLVYFMAGRERPGAALRAGAALALTPLLFDCASQGIVDAMLAFFTTLAVAGCASSASGGGRRGLAAACAGLAGGALTKGPVGVAVPLCAAFLWLAAERRIRDLLLLMLKLGVFLAAFAALCAAWIAAVEGTETLARLMEAQLFDRVGDEANASRLYYTWVFLGGLAPWSVFALAGLFLRADPAKAPPAAPAGLRALSWCWFLSTFILLSLAAIKHSRYLLPAAPPVAVLAAFFWDDLRLPGAPSWASAVTEWIRRACLAALVLGAAALAVAPFVLPVASPALACILPPACLLPLLLRSLRRGDGAFTLLAWVLAAGLLAFSQFDSPRAAAKEEARPFVREVERAAAGKLVVFYGIRKDADGLKFLWWRTGTGPLSFTESLPGLRASLAAPAILVVPASERAEVERDLGPRLRFLLDGRLGKRRCAVFEASGRSDTSGS